MPAVANFNCKISNWFNFNATELFLFTASNLADLESVALFPFHLSKNYSIMQKCISLFSKCMKD